MKLKLKNGLIRDCEREIGELLVASELAIEVLPPPIPTPTVRWKAVEGQFLNGNFRCEPELRFICSFCTPQYSGTTFATGPNAHNVEFRHDTAIKDGQVIQCPLKKHVEHCPPDVARQYQVLWAAFSKVRAPKPDPLTARERLGLGRPHLVGLERGNVTPFDAGATILVSNS